MNKTAFIIGNSDGIGLNLSKKLLEQDWEVTGLSRSNSSINHTSYKHIVIDVQNIEYSKTLKAVLKEHKTIDLCVYCAGIGEALDFARMEKEIEVFEVNLLGMIKTTSIIIPHMVQQGKGHFIGISSVADELLSHEAPSYSASKAGFSSYLEGLALAMKPKNVNITNVRFGFVNTKMAKAPSKPFMMEVEKATVHLLKCIEKKPIRYTAPWIVIPMVKILKWLSKMKILL